MVLWTRMVRTALVEDLKQNLLLLSLQEALLKVCADVLAEYCVLCGVVMAKRVPEI